jgi:amino acid adenylation domain-containing protein
MINPNVVLTSEDHKNHLQYWKSQLLLQKDNFHLNWNSKASFNGKKNEDIAIQLKLTSENETLVNDISGGNDLGKFVILSTGIFYLLNRYSNHDVVRIDTPCLTGNGNQFIQVVPLIVQVDHSQSLKHFIGDIRHTIIKSYDYQNFPVQQLVEEKKSGTDSLHKTNVILSFPEIHDKHDLTQYDLILEIHRNPEIVISVKANAKWDTSDFTSKFQRHLNNFLCYLKATGTLLKDIDILSQDERAKIIDEFNSTSFKLPAYETVIEVFEEITKQHSERIAVIHKDKKFTYDEINRKSNQLAHSLQQDFNIQTGDVVGLMADRSELMIIGLLGILKAGAVYLPVNPELPSDKIRYIADDAAMKLLLLHSDYLGTASIVSDVPMFALNFQLQNLESPVTSPQNKTKADDVAYIIYTSGSTGNPKGVLIEHSGLLNVSLEHIFKLEISIEDKYLQFMSPSFDGSMLDVFTTLLGGATLVQIDKEVILDPKLFINYISTHKISIFTATPSYLISLDKHPLETVRTIISAGEAAKVETATHYAGTKNFFNGYGPSEVTVNATLYKVKPGKNYERIPIGKPGANKKIYIVDELLRVVPEGIVGEICIAGAGIARGYLNDKNLTEEKFIDNPYQTGERLYRSGDLGKWLPDGDIEYIGRKDTQVKVRGYRIELSAIERAILEFPAVKDVLVEANNEDEEIAFLIAFIVKGNDLDIKALKDFLKKHLADYMIPAHFVLVDHFPMNFNGKVDRKALLSLDVAFDENISSGYVAPRNVTEEKLADIFKDALNRKQVGMKDNFFDIGGHSLKATQIATQIHKAFNVKIEVKDIFQTPVIEDIALLILNNSETNYSFIERIYEPDNCYLVSHAQKRLWILDQIEAGQTAYNMPNACVFEGKLSLIALEQAFHALIERHEILRTTFDTFDGVLKQKIHPYSKANFNLEYFDFRNFPDRESKARALASKESTTSFDLKNGPLVRASLIQLEEERFLFLYTLHHIVGDLWSLEIFQDDLIKLYDIHFNQTQELLPGLTIQYKDYAYWQQFKLKEANVKPYREFWFNAFSDEIPVINLPTDFARPAVKTFNGSHCVFSFPKELHEGIHIMDSHHGTSTFMTLLASVNVLLYHYTEQSDIIVGTPMAGREHDELYNQIGFFVNTLPLRTKLDSSDTVDLLLRKVKENTLNAYKYQLYPFDLLVDDLNLKRDLSRSALFDVTVEYQKQEAFVSRPKSMANGTIANYPIEFQVSKFDLTFSFTESDDRLSLSVIYNTDLFQKASIERMIIHYKQLLESMIKDPSAQIDNLNMLGYDETNQLLNEFNSTEVDYKRAETVIQLFEDQVSRFPDKVAVVFKDQELTFQQLNSKANQLARLLEDTYAIKEGDLVSIMLDRSSDLIVGLLGILKTGAAFVPIDPLNPRERIKAILNDSNAKVLITESNYQDIKLETNSILFFIDYSWTNKILNPAENHTPSQGARDLLYVIYTSGSTGKPKGVSIENGSLLNYVAWLNSELNINETDSSVLLTSYAFDLCYTALWGTLLNGGTLHILSPDVVYDSDNFVQYLIGHKISNLKLTPNLFSVLLLDQLDKISSLSVRLIILGGEPIHGGDVQKYLQFSPDTIFVNEYGPTETTVGSVALKISQKDVLTLTDKPLIGIPISNTQVYVTTQNMGLKPVGIPGELCIGGKGLAREYLNSPALTHSKFVKSTFHNEQRLYRTGDQARWLPDGTLEYLGRKDEQVKIRGYRVELLEIKNVLLGIKLIKDAAIVATSTRGAELLKAFVIAENDLTAEDIQEALKNHLPAYMIPDIFVFVDKFLLTSNGKIDFKTLEANSSDDSEKEFSQAKNDTEEQLLIIWKEVLQSEQIGVVSNFFELGGHSLKAIQLITRVHKQFQVKLDLRTIFQNPTISGLARHVLSSEKRIDDSIKPLPKQLYYETSHAQKRFWILNQFQKDDISYNMPECYTIEGKLEVDVFERTVNKVVARHEILRTTFESVNGVPMQKINEGKDFAIAFFDLRSGVDKVNTARGLAIEDARQGFDLSKGPLLRIKLFQIEDERYLIFLNIHHVVSDGWSRSILINELLEIYNGNLNGVDNLLPPLSIQYKEFAEWQNNKLSNDSVDEHKNYWANQFKGEIPLLNLPVDFPRPPVRTTNANCVKVTLNKTSREGLFSLSKNAKTSLFTTLAALVNVLLYKYTGQEDIVIGTPVSLRTQHQLENQVGLYLNNLPLRTKFSGKEKFTSLLEKVKVNLTDALDHQLYPFDRLVEDLNLVRDMSRSPLFDVVIVSDENDGAMNQKHMAGVSITPYDLGFRISSIDLRIIFITKEDEIVVSVDYNTDLFKETKIKKLLDCYTTLVQSVLSNSELQLDQLQYIPEEEKSELLNAFNPPISPRSEYNSVIELFEKTVRQYPDKTAVVYKGTSLSYAALNEKANLLARYLLITYSLDRSSVICLMTEPSEASIIGMLAIFKIGCIYLPLDPNAPKERNEHILRDADVKLLLTESTWIFNIDFYTGSLFALDVELSSLTGSIENLKLDFDRELAYLIYTSGSTGRPKGVMIKHVSLVNRILYFTEYLNVDSNECILQFASLWFDASMYETFMALTTGGSLVLVDYNTKNDIESLIELIERQKVSFITFPPAYLKMLNKHQLPSVRKIVSTGEAAVLEDAIYYASFKDYFNGYGPTETCIGATFYEVNPEYAEQYRLQKSIPIGAPFDKTIIFILDKNLNILPAGVSGEIFISGIGLAAGYLNNPELTAQKFILNPYSCHSDDKIMYRTGDIGRWNERGIIEFQGRLDDQVQIRGIRVELGEIENILLGYSYIQSAVILANEDQDGNTFLAAYIISKDHFHLTDLKNYLRSLLPEYMVPSYYVRLKEFTYTSTGKIDRKALAELDIEFLTGSDEYAAPENETEKKLVEIWERILAQNKISVNDHFFDIGGTSLKLVMLLQELSLVYPGKLSIADLFKYTTIRELTHHLSAEMQTKDLKNIEV